MDESTAKKLSEVLSPDNRTVPHDQRFAMERRARSLEFTIASDRAQSAFSTLVGVLEDVSLFQEVWLLSHERHA